MIRKITLSAVAVSMFASLSSAGVDFDRGGLDLRSELASQAAPEVPSADKGVFSWIFGKPSKPQPKAAAEWTIMLFSNAKNDLERFLLKDINEMEMVGSTDKVNLVVQVGRMDGYDSSDGDWKGVRRYYVTKDNDVNKMGSKLVEDLGMIDMGDYKNVVSFAQWAKAKYPAKKYMLIISNHGAGWEKGARARVLQNKGISYDEQSGNHINTPQLGLVLKEIGGLDVFSTDACLMQMAEVVYEIKDYVTYIVGSEETEPGDGYTYNDFLAPLVARPAMTPQEVGKLTVDAYSNHYDGINQGYTQSLAKSAAVGGLLTVTNDFASAVMAAGEKDLAKSARGSAVNFAMEDNRDLYDFTRLVVEGSQNDAVKAKGQALMNYITGTLMLHTRARDSQGGYWSEPKQYTLAKGMAVYIPSYGIGNGYDELKWAQASNWDEFIQWMNQP